MPIQKNQHYVPRSYLSKFSGYENGKAIDMFSIPHRKIIRGAPVKTQCSKNYFYGDDLSLENTLSEIEGAYALAVRDLIAKEGRIGVGEKEILRCFSIIQHQRTDAAVRRNIIAQEKMNFAVGRKFREALEEMEMDHDRALTIALSSCLEIFNITEDMGYTIIKNETNVMLMTSDDPVVLINKFYHQKIKSGNYGFQSSGLIVYMPISPLYGFILYDKDVYSFASTENVLRIFKPQDVEALNDCIFGKASYNVYFSGGFSQIDMDSYLARNEKQRTYESHTVNVAIQTGTKGNDEYYRTAKPEEVDGPGPFLVELHTNYPAPPRWPSFLNYSLRPKTRTNGSAAGHVRPAIFLRRALHSRERGAFTRHIMEPPTAG